MDSVLQHKVNVALEHRKLETLVENKTSFSLDNAQLNVYETYRVSERVSLTFEVPILASMIRGKKVMHLKDRPSFDFLPGESLVVPAGQEMVIDFPIATHTAPTQCLALAFAPQSIRNAVEIFNDNTLFNGDQPEWAMGEMNAHIIHDEGVQQVLNRLVGVFTENIKGKDAIAELTIRELLIRLLQTEAKTLLLNHRHIDPRLTPVIRYVRNHVHENISIEDLSQQAYMSQGHFFRYFKNVMGITPMEFVHQERINRAKLLLGNKLTHSLSEIVHAVGFNNTSYFIKLFKKYTGKTPIQYRKEKIN